MSSLANKANTSDLSAFNYINTDNTIPFGAQLVAMCQSEKPTSGVKCLKIYGNASDGTFMAIAYLDTASNAMGFATNFGNSYNYVFTVTNNLATFKQLQLIP